MQSVNTEEADLTTINVNQDGFQQFQARRNSCDPDSCWSWLVCVVCAFCNIIICGLTYSYGILFPSLLDEFQQGKAKTGKLRSLVLLLGLCLLKGRHTREETSSCGGTSLRVFPYDLSLEFKLVWGLNRRDKSSRLVRQIPWCELFVDWVSPGFWSPWVCRP